MAYLLSDSADSSVSDDSDSETGGQSGKTDRQSSAELDEARVERHRGLEVSRDEDRNNEAVNGDDTSHDDGDDALHH